MKIETYELSTRVYAIKVEVAHDIFTDERAEEINDFWGDGKYWLDKSGGNLLHAVLSRLFSVAQDITLFGSVNQVNPAAGLNEEISKREGWPPLDGSWGIKIVDANREVCLNIFPQIRSLFVEEVES